MILLDQVKLYKQANKGFWHHCLKHGHAENSDSDTKAVFSTQHLFFPAAPKIVAVLKCVCLSVSSDKIMNAALSTPLSSV